MLQEPFEVLRCEIGVLEHFVKQPRPDGLTRVDRDDRAPSVLVVEEMVASPHSNDREACTAEGSSQLPACDSGQPAHAATVTL